MTENLGLSGDTIILNDDNVVKICETNQLRFLNNINKQKNFNNIYISSIPIIEDGIINNKNYIKMPRLKCDNAIVWMSKTDTQNIVKLTDLFIKYLQELINSSEIKPFDYNQWLDKIHDLKFKIKDSFILDILNKLEKSKFNNLFYYGDYHGDFTLSNLFIYNQNDQPKIDAIDFLDTFIYSPINDLIKLRQDTKHLWTINLIKNFQEIDLNRAIIFINYIDKKIKDIIDENVILSEYYLPFQLLNLIRIIPYLKRDLKIFNYLKSEIKSLEKEWNH